MSKFFMNNNQPAANIFLAFMNLTRLRIAGMELVACSIGFILSYSGHFPLLRFFWTLVGTGLLSGGACALNCYMERDLDALMPRTCRRPIPAGVISPTNALIFGLSLVTSGCFLLIWQVNMLSGMLGLTAAFVYLAIYTPSKRLTWLNTSIGAVPGAIPPLIGWASATGQIDPGGWCLFTMLFLWQHTHFFPIAWLYRDDYQKAGFRMLPVLELKGEKTFILTIVAAVALLPISMLLSGMGLAGSGSAYCFGSALLCVLLIAAGVRLSKQRSRPAAHAVLFLSLFYLPVILAAVILDRYGIRIGSHFHDWLETIWRWT